ncbi:hypothetical protein TNCV_2237581 [Trichonephila clavipes]|nr:hypothetical protein TNCV_2237581 [Trichonephila clavipes]
MGFHSFDRTNRVYEVSSLTIKRSSCPLISALPIGAINDVSALELNPSHLQVANERMGASRECMEYAYHNEDKTLRS